MDRIRREHGSVAGFVISGMGGPKPTRRSKYESLSEIYNVTKYFVLLHLILKQISI